MSEYGHIHVDALHHSPTSSVAFDRLVEQAFKPSPDHPKIISPNSEPTPKPKPSPSYFETFVFSDNRLVQVLKKFPTLIIPFIANRRLLALIKHSPSFLNLILNNKEIAAKHSHELLRLTTLLSNPKALEKVEPKIQILSHKVLAPEIVPAIQAADVEKLDSAAELASLVKDSIEFERRVRLLSSIREPSVREPESAKVFHHDFGENLIDLSHALDRGEFDSHKELISKPIPFQGELKAPLPSLVGSQSPQVAKLTQRNLLGYFYNSPVYLALAGAAGAGIHKSKENRKKKNVYDENETFVTEEEVISLKKLQPVDEAEMHRIV